MATENVAYNVDCMEHMKSLPDDYYDLVIADPPYGAGLTEGGGCKGWFTKYHQEQQPEPDNPIDRHNLRGRFARYDDSSQTVNVERERSIPQYNRFGNPGSRFERYKGEPDGRDMGGEIRKKIIAWDVAPGKEVFAELFRVSRNQIIWGGNYFELPPTRCFLIWRKLSISESFTMAMAEYAWTSFNDNAKVFECAPQGKSSDPRFHPCLPAGTKVLFDGTWKNIEDIKAGAKNEFGVVSGVSSHTAHKMVEIHAENKIVTATWNHPFLVKRGRAVYWINADQLIEGDELLCLRKHTLSPKKDTSDTELTERGSGWNIAWFGKNTMERFLKVCKSITSTVIRPTTTLRTSSLSLRLSTSGCTKVANLWTVFGISLANAAESTKPSRKKTGISDMTKDGYKARYVNHATSKKSSKIVVCGYQKVGSVRIINKETKVYNLTLDGVPAFETEIGITHNTQKPIDLYRWIYGLFTEPGQRVFDPFLGSGSSRIAAYEAGLNFVGTEIDPVYFQKEERSHCPSLRRHVHREADDK